MQFRRPNACHALVQVKEEYEGAKIDKGSYYNADPTGETSAASPPQSSPCRTLPPMPTACLLLSRMSSKILNSFATWMYQRLHRK